MALQLGDEAPDFTADSTEGELHFHEYLGDGWGVLFSHPADFTPVCTTELGRVAALKGEFEQRNTKVVGLSVDSMENHESWNKDIEEVTGHKVNFPLVSDKDREVAKAYGVLRPDGMSNRVTYVVDQAGKIDYVEVGTTAIDPTGADTACSRLAHKKTP